MKLLIDTNVLIDLFARREGYYQDAVNLMATSVFGDNELWASAGSFTDIFYILTKQGAAPRALQNAFEKSLEHLHVCSIDQEDILQAARDTWPDFEDRMIAGSAQKIRADLIITRDKNGFEQSAIPSMTPQAFFTHMEQDHGIVYDEIDF